MRKSSKASGSRAFSSRYCCIMGVRLASFMTGIEVGELKAHPRKAEDRHRQGRPGTTSRRTRNGSLPEGLDVGPEGTPAITLGLRELGELGLVAQPHEVGVGHPTLERPCDGRSRL